MERGIGQNTEGANLHAQKESLDRQIAVMDVLNQYGLITATEDVDLDALVLKKEDLKVLHATLSNEAAIALAYLDTDINKAREQGVAVNDIVNSLPRGLIVSLISNPVARNDDNFIDTVFANLKLVLNGSTGDFSEVLLSVVQARLASYLNVVSGVLDKDGVVTTKKAFNAEREAEGGVTLH